MYLNAPLLEGEDRRLDALRRLRLLDTAFEPEFDNLVELAASHFGVAYALISLIDSDRQWFKARFGLDAAETPRDVSFCGHAIAGDETFLVLDAQADARFAKNPLVTGSPHVRFYAGAPLVHGTSRIGTLCIIDTDRRAAFPARDNRHLRQFAQIAEELIEARRKRLCT